MARLLLLPLLLIAAACASDTDPFQPPERPGSLAEAQADSVAQRLVAASGGAAWHRVESLRFTFAIDDGVEVSPVAHHVWDRRRNRYRVEWPAGAPPESTYVGLFSSWPEAVAVYRGGVEVDSVRGRSAADVARSRTINDTYWLLAPFKVFDPGVRRVYVPDSSTATHDVIQLSFQDVGLTPGDQYWLFVNRETGLLDRWTFLLQNAESPGSYRWTGYESHAGRGGDVMLSTRKELAGGERAILTHQVQVGPSPGAEEFQDPLPRLEQR